jgi:flagellar hook-associated protein 2
MTIQSQPLDQLQSQQAGLQSTLSAYGQEQSALSSLQTAAAALTLPSAFEASAATVSGSGVTASVTGTPANATYSVNVSALAQAQSEASTAVSDPTATLATGTLTIQMGTYNASGNSFSASASASPITVTIDSTNDTLNGIAAAINSAASGSVNASVVTDATGSRLVLTSANTGVSNAFTVSASSGLSQFAFDPTAAAGSQSTTMTQTAQNASFTVNGLALSSASNSVSTAINGLTLNLTQAPAAGAAPLQSQVTVATDPTAVESSVNAFITAYNAVISLTNSLTNYDAGSNTASVLTGDPTTRDIVGQLQSVIGSQTTAAGTSAATTSYLAEIGVTTNADGTLSLDSTTFQSALAADPTGVAAMFSAATGTGSQQGFAVQINNLTQQVLGSGGALGSAEQSLQSQISDLKSRESAMQAQLTQTQANLTQEYSALNAALTAAQNEQTSLANELNQLPG